MAVSKEAIIADTGPQFVHSDQIPIQKFTITLHSLAELENRVVFIPATLKSYFNLGPQKLVFEAMIHQGITNQQQVQEIITGEVAAFHTPPSRNHTVQYFPDLTNNLNIQRVHHETELREINGDLQLATVRDAKEKDFLRLAKRMQKRTTLP